MKYIFDLLVQICAMSMVASMAIMLLVAAGAVVYAAWKIVTE